MKSIYTFLRPWLFLLPPESAHAFTLGSLACLNRLGLVRDYARAWQENTQRVFGLDFKNPLGIAAGLDKNGDYIEALAALGVGFIEAGTVTPKPQPGNSKPRLFRLPAHDALINRMGFNNKGIDHLVAQLESVRKNNQCKAKIGVNLGKNAWTPVEDAASDYLIGLKKCHAYADYIVVNISSPNTPGLRTLQYGEHLQNLLEVLKNEQDRLQTQHKKHTPLLVKIAPDLSERELDLMVKQFLNIRVEGIIATNTTSNRDMISGHPQACQAGGLSGWPLKPKADWLLKLLSERLEGQIPIIASGGVMSPQDVADKLMLGANLVQVYTGLIYYGPRLISDSLALIGRAER